MTEESELEKVIDILTETRNGFLEEKVSDIIGTEEGHEHDLLDTYFAEKLHKRIGKVFDGKKHIILSEESGRIDSENKLHYEKADLIFIIDEFDMSKPFAKKITIHKSGWIKDAIPIAYGDNPDYSDIPVSSISIYKSDGTPIGNAFIDMYHGTVFYADKTGMFKRDIDSRQLSTKKRQDKTVATYFEGRPLYINRLEQLKLKPGRKSFHVEPGPHRILYLLKDADTPISSKKHSGIFNNNHRLTEVAGYIPWLQHMENDVDITHYHFKGRPTDNKIQESTEGIFTDRYKLDFASIFRTMEPHKYRSMFLVELKK
jgi:hypothetical protein